MIERLDYIFYRLEALKQQREEGRAINVLASQEQYSAPPAQLHRWCGDEDEGAAQREAFRTYINGN